MSRDLCLWLIKYSQWSKARLVCGSFKTLNILKGSTPPIGGSTLQCNLLIGMMLFSCPLTVKHQTYSGSGRGYIYVGKVGRLQIKLLTSAPSPGWCVSSSSRMIGVENRAMSMAFLSRDGDASWGGQTRNDLSPRPALVLGFFPTWDCGKANILSFFLSFFQLPKITISTTALSHFRTNTEAHIHRAGRCSDLN